MRSAWKKQKFQNTHIAQIRDPLSECELFAVQPFFRNTLIRIALDLCATIRCFAHIGHSDRFAEAF